LASITWISLPKLQALPEDGHAVTLWTNQDEAFLDIAHGIRSIAEKLLDIPSRSSRLVQPSLVDRILALEKHLGFIPAYFDDLLSLVSGPKRFIAERLSRDEPAIQKALIFLVVSIFISWGLQTPWIQSNPLLELITDIVFVLIYVMAYGGALYLAWYIAGGRSERQKFLTIHFYYSGVLKLMMTSVYLGTMGTLRAADPALFKAICNAAHGGSIVQFLSANSSQLLENPGFLLCLGVLYVGCGAMLTWIFAGWGAYRELNQLSKRRSIMAGLLFFAFCFPVTVVISVIANSLVRQTVPC
jgi:hypothetical protein